MRPTIKSRSNPQPVDRLATTIRKRGQKQIPVKNVAAHLVPATPWDEPRTKGRRWECYTVLRGGRIDMLKAAWDAGIHDEATLWEIAHAPGLDRYGIWWRNPEYRITSCGRRETPIPPHGWANLMYWLRHGRMWRPDGSIPFKEGSVPSFFLRSLFATSS